MRNSQNKSLNFLVYHLFSVVDLKLLENKDGILLILVTPAKVQQSVLCVVGTCSKMFAEGMYTSFLSPRAEVRIKEVIFVKFFGSVKSYANGSTVFSEVLSRSRLGDLHSTCVRGERNSTRLSE